MLGRASKENDMPRIAVLIVAAGKGERARLGPANQLGLPKQYERLAGQPMLRRTVKAFLAHPSIPKSHVQVVIAGGQQELAASTLSGLDVPMPVLGGATRQE